MLQRFRGATGIVDKAFKQAVKKTGAVIDSETAKNLKERTRAVVTTATSIGKNLTDLNGDGKIDVEDIKFAAEKAGIAWDKIDPDIKTALVAGGVAGIGVNFVPFIGQMLAVPTFALTTAYFYLVAKLKSLGKK